MSSLEQKLIEKQKELISFYGEYINKHTWFLAVHWVKASQEEIDKWEKLRWEIENLDSEYLKKKYN